MRRLPITPRPAWLADLVDSGMDCPVYVLESGAELTYWDESAAWELSSSDVGAIEGASEAVAAKCSEAVAFLLNGEFGSLGLDPALLAACKKSFDDGFGELVWRMDMVLDQSGAVNLFALNCDSPTGILETSLTQWQWLEQVRPDRDQLNSLHERLVLRWPSLAQHFTLGPLHVSTFANAPEPQMTVSYLAETATEAGISVVFTPIDQLGWDAVARRVVDQQHGVVSNVLKQYPWDDMVKEPFGQHVIDGSMSVRWAAPLWSWLASSPVMLAALSAVGAPVVAQMHTPAGLVDWLALDAISGEQLAQRSTEQGLLDPPPVSTESRPVVFVERCRLREDDGIYSHLAVFVVAGSCAGVGMFEHNGPAVGPRPRFVPHFIDELRPSDQQMAAWLT